jgi:DNA mismatch endonuclease (patch repair protein)
MKANRRRDTRPEVSLRKQLHAQGFRYRVDHPVNLSGRRPVRIDIAFTRLKLAVFIDGCFWHRCPEHGTTPSKNHTYWDPKLARNVMRDREIDDALGRQGWTILRIWEHNSSDQAVAAVRQAVDRSSVQPGSNDRA